MLESTIEPADPLVVHLRRVQDRDSGVANDVVGGVRDVLFHSEGRGDFRSHGLKGLRQRQVGGVTSIDRTDVALDAAVCLTFTLDLT